MVEIDHRLFHHLSAHSHIGSYIYMCDILGHSIQGGILI